MLPLEIIKKYYPNASDDELKDIQEVVYLLACAVMQHFYGPSLGESPKANLANMAGLAPRAGRNGWEVLKNQSKKKNCSFKTSSIPVWV